MEKHRKHDGDIFAQSLKLCAMSVGTVLVRREFFDLIGLFDEDLPVCEDYDLWLRFTAFHPVRLIPEALVIREGGHEDQLSHRFKGMDRYRIRALLKLLGNPDLPKLHRASTLSELASKCKIYGNGCRKHGRPGEALYYLSLPFGVPS
jgi:GT2 family glycosyltransferase